ncbi:MAG: flagellar basal body rod protein FlgC [Rhodospirillales bacterium]|nr:flagellar basal body rod protein FlgC [Rhodospirillales bacterium]
MTDLATSMQISAAGMRVQGTRLRIIAENLANAGSTAESAEKEPYRRKTLTFENVLDRSLGVETVRVRRFGEDPSELPRRFEPGHPAADANGYVATSNVKGVIEMGDMREAQRSYEANLNVIKSSKAMIEATIDVLR